MPSSTRLSSEIYRLCIREHARQFTQGLIVEESIAVPFFGDIDAYFLSPKRILTAALNPSDLEFSRPRFAVRNYDNDHHSYEQTLSNYFKFCPYENWFRNFEQILNGLDCTFGGKLTLGNQSSTALHIDFCTPLATKKKWSKLDPVERESLQRSGRTIFEMLVSELRPQLIVCSVAKDTLDNFLATSGVAVRSRQSHKLYEKSSKGKLLRWPLTVDLAECFSKDQFKLTIVNGSAAQTPFGRFSGERKVETGKWLDSHTDWTPDT